MATKPGHLHSVSLPDCGYRLSEASGLGKGGGMEEKSQYVCGVGRTMVGFQPWAGMSEAPTRVPQHSYGLQTVFLTSLKWSCRQLFAAGWVLGMKPRSFARIARALNHRAISSST